MWDISSAFTLMYVLIGSLGVIWVLDCYNISSKRKKERAAAEKKMLKENRETELRQAFYMTQTIRNEKIINNGSNK